MKSLPKEKSLVWVGSTYRDITDEKTFPAAARREAGHQLNTVQRGADPDKWKPFEDVGPGTKEIIIDLEDGWYRVMCVAKFSEAVYVLHCFKKKTNVTSDKEKKIATANYKAVVTSRSGK
jgi:phage-related protein